MMVSKEGLLWAITRMHRGFKPERNNQKKKLKIKN